MSHILSDSVMAVLASAATISTVWAVIRYHQRWLTVVALACAWQAFFYVYLIRAPEWFALDMNTRLAFFRPSQVLMFSGLVLYVYRSQIDAFIQAMCRRKT